MNSRRDTARPPTGWQFRLRGSYSTDEPDIWRHSSDIGDGLRLHVTLHRRDGEVFVDELTIEAPNGGTPLPTTSLFRRLRMGALQDDLLYLVRSPVSPWPDVVMDPKRMGRRRKDDAFYAMWAKRYVDALEEDPKRPVAWIVEHHDEHTTEAAVRGYVNKARVRKLLTKAPKGKPGGHLTNKAKAILAKGNTWQQ